MRKNPLLLSILAALPACSETYEDRGCMYVPEEQTTCPPASSVSPERLFLPGACGDCCYTVQVVDHDVNSGCIVGRPYFEGDRALSAPLLGGRAKLSPDLPARAAAWAKAGAAEHASVAAFARLALQLLGHAAPAELLTGVHEAALDEIRHAELCWSLSEQFGGMRVAPGRFPFGAPVSADVSLAELALSAVREGCLGETLGAHVVAVAAELATEPAVRSVLSFRIVAWALAVGGPEVRSAVLAALRAPWPELDVEELAQRSNVPTSELAGAARDGIREVLEPAVARLLAA
jgi:hypothetical protein